MKLLKQIMTVLMAMSVVNAYAAQSCLQNVAHTAPDSRFTVSGDTVTDTQTALMWQRCVVGSNSSGCTTSSGTNATWQGAFALAQQANSEKQYGYNDWRVPSIAELRTLQERACEHPATNATIFPNLDSDIWSATLDVSQANKAWVLKFGQGGETLVNIGTQDKTQVTQEKSRSLRVILVRGGIEQ